MGENKLCLGCMEPKSISSSVCPHCGYTEGTPGLPSYIEPGTVLHDRYLIGKVLSHNGEGATYIAYDNVMTCKMIIREYMPENMCVRVKDKPIISVNHNCLAQYKSWMAEFTELNKSLARMRTLSHISPAIDLFAENNTTYAVYEYIECISLIEYLKENAGELSWEQVSKLFPPLFTTLSIIHNTGIVHRGISPHSIHYTEKGELRIMDFCVSAARTEKTELNAELFRGYAAPEQYAMDGRQGTWTDVYGICAVLYRVLTGTMPTEAMSRIDNDNLCAPYEINPNIPQHVSKVIMAGLALSGRERIQTITELVTRLFEYNEERGKAPTATISIPKQRLDSDTIIANMSGAYNKNNANNYDEQYDDNYDDENADYDENYDDEEYDDVKSAPNSFERIKIAVIVSVLLLAILMVIVIIVLKSIGANETESLIDSQSTTAMTDNNVVTVPSTDISTMATTETASTETSNDLNCQMTNLVGKSYDLQSQSLADYLTFERVDVYNSEYAEGQIVSQSIKEGEWYAQGSTVKVEVSKGPASVPVPSYTNVKYTDYTNTLDSMGIKYTLVAETDYKSANGTVLRTSVAAGSNISRENDEKLTVYYADNPETTAAPQATTPAPTPETTAIPANVDSVDANA